MVLDSIEPENCSLRRLTDKHNKLYVEILTSL